MFKRIFLIVVFISLTTFSLSAQDSAPSVGINLASVVDWSTQWVFVDMFKMARPWISQREGANWGEGGALALTPEGWVASLEAGQYAETIMMIDEGEDVYPFGDYVLLYDGEGTFDVSPLNGISITNTEAGRIIISRTANSPVFLRLRTTNPDNPARNLRFIMPGFEATYADQVFHPAFLEFLSPFSTLRYMDWMNTNYRGGEGEWSNRPQVTDATYAMRGVPVEVMIDLANRSGKDVWFNMPYAATDEYVREFATIVRDQLNPELTAYVEYSNEDWNGIFPSHFYVKEQGRALSLANGDEFMGGMLFHSQRSVEVFNIWENVFGSTERFVRVMGGWAANSYINEQLLLHNNAFEHTDALAIAPYFSCEDFGDPQVTDAILANGLDALMEAQMAHITSGCALEYVTFNGEVARQYGVDLIAYEGGQHLASFGEAQNNDSLTALLIAANHDPRMYDAYMAYLESWFANDGGLFMLFSSIDRYSRFGSWGLLEYQMEPIENAPKYRAVLDFIGQ